MLTEQDPTAPELSKQQAGRNIFLFGHRIKDDEEEFKSPSEFTDYIERGVFEDAGGRYRYGQKKKPISLAEYGITGIQFGKRLSEKEFAEIVDRGGAKSPNSKN